MASSTSKLQDRRALVLYGSETGNAQDVAEELGRIAERLRFDTDVAELNAVTIRQLVQYPVILIAISTTGQGELPPNSQTFWRALRSTRLRPGCLRQMRFASFGLGDTSYPKYNWAHRKLYNRLVQLGAEPICDRSESDEQHPDGVDGAFANWSPTLRQRLLEEYPLPDGVFPIPDDVLLDPKWLLDAFDPASTPLQDGESKENLKDSEEDIPPPDLLDIPHGLTATIVQNQRITPKTHWQDVRHLKLDISGHHPYTPGDVLTIYPMNFPSDVNEFLRIQNWTSIADVPLKFVPTKESSTSSRPPLPHTPSDTPLTLRTLLTSHLDIMSIPRRSFFATLAHFTEDEFQRERLLEFTNSEYIDELYDYTTRPRRSILEVLQEFETVRIPWQRICSLVPGMRGRQFSIASAFDAPTTTASAIPYSVDDGEKGDDGNGDGGEGGDEGEKKTRIELLIAIVKYRTVIKRIRQGVCTRYISTLQPSQNITVTLSKGGLHPSPSEISKPVVMIGPGTGIAPMRALIYQRRIWRREEKLEEKMSSDNGDERDVLFFGCRNADADYFFKDEWASLAKDNVPLDVFPAFSRDQRQKVYVQDLVRQHSARVYDALANKGGLVYICGSSGKMPQAVREALIEGFEKHGGLGREEAEEYLAGMEKSGRYRQETW